MMAGTKRRFAVAAAAMLAAFAAAGAGSASAAAPSQFFGMQAVGRPSQAELGQMVRGGVGTFRLGISWASVEPTQGSPRLWTQIDAQVTGLAAAGLQPLPLLFGVPPWISSHPAHPPLDNAGQKSAWQSFVSDVARRYGPNGDFWRLHPELPQKTFTDWEVWNEANLNGYWDRRPSATQYGELLKLTSSALRSVDATAQVIVGGLFPNPRRAYGSLLTKFLDRLYKVPGIRAAFDGVAVHPYAGRPRGVVEVTEEARDVIKQHHDRGTTLWITELGWSTGGQGWAHTPFRATLKTQATKLRSTYKRLIKLRGRLRLQGVVWHIWRDVYGPGQESALYQTGLLQLDGTPKPAWGAYAAVAGGTAS